MNIQHQTRYAEDHGKIIRPLLCERCRKKKTLIRHHRDYDKPLEITWVCRLCHKIDHATHEIKGVPDAHMVNFGKPTLWEGIWDATTLYNIKHHTCLTRAGWLRMEAQKAVNRTLKKGK